MNGRVVWCFEWLSVMSEVWGEEVCNVLGFVVSLQV